MKKALIIAAHPDDETLGCGGIISRFSDSTEFKVVFISEGTSCRYADLAVHKEEIEENIEIRKSSASRALRTASVSFYDLPCGRLDQVPQLVINKIIEQEIQDFQPDTVFTHWANDANTDHRKVHDATIIATRPYSSLVETVLCYEVLSSTEWNFNKTFCPNAFYQLSETDIKNKCLSMQEYHTECKEWPHPRSDEGITTLAKMRGMQSGFEHAEAFQIMRICI
tara:strand:- start:842 stop:1513 length:672 start_codon:yes stop_codon:yes gene_type:complete